MRFPKITPPRAALWLAILPVSLVPGSLTPRPAFAQAASTTPVTTTTVQGTVYTAAGAPASGSVQLSWASFTTNAGQAVAAGQMYVTIGADGFFSVNLAPNAGAMPAGLYYTAIFHLSDGTTSTEYWTVPAAAQATIAQVRAQVMPAAQAVQAASKSYVDNAISTITKGSLASNGGALTGPLYLNGDPTAPTQAADKHYVDGQLAQALPLSGGAATGPLTAAQLGAVYQVDQFAGSDFGAKLQACLKGLNQSSGGVCDARNFASALTMTTAVTISTPNAAIYLPCSTITTANSLTITAGTRNVAIHGCSYQGGSTANGAQGGTVWVYTGTGNAFQVGDMTGAVNTPGFWMHDLNLNTANAGTSATGIYFKRAQELRLDGVYLNGNSTAGSTTGQSGAGQTGIVLDGTGNYAGGTFIDVYINGFATGWQLTGDTAGNYANASTFIKTHVVCPTSSGTPIAGTIGINLLEGDGNTWSGGDVESCSTMFHLGASAINNTIVGLRNENSTIQYQADSGSSFNSVLTGGTLYTGQLVDNGSRNSFSDAFHRASNGIKGDWYASQQDATVTNHQRLGTGQGNERGLLNEVQTDYGNRWLEGYSDAAGTGYQIWQLSDLINNVNRFSVGQYLSTTANAVTNVVLNNGGCYTSNTPPAVTFSGGGGTGATATANMTTTASPNCNNGAGYQVGSVTITSGGSGYTSAPTVAFAGSNQVTAPNPTAEIVTAGGTNSQTVINAAGSGAIVLNGSNNAGTGGVVIGSGGAANSTIATISGTGNAQFAGTLQAGGAAQAGGTMSVRNNADAEVDYYLWPGLTTSQKGSFTYKDWNGASQWYMVKDASNNWALNSAIGGLDSFKAYQSGNSGDTYINSSNTSGHIRLNYESGSGTETDIYSNGTLDASFLGPTSIKFPGIAAATSGSHYCLQVDSSGYLTNTGGACVTASSGASGQIASYSSSSGITGISSVPVTSGGTGATTSAAALTNLGAQPAMSGVASNGSNGLSVTGSVAAASAIAGQVNGTWSCSGFAASGGSTQCDAAWSSLLSGTTLGTSASLTLPANTSTTNSGFSLPSGGPFSITLNGQGTGEFHGGSTLQATAALTAPVVNIPAYPTSQSNDYNSNAHLANFTIHANNQPVACLAAYGIRASTFDNLSCLNSQATRSWVNIGGLASSIGGPVASGYNHGGFQDFVHNLFIFNNGYAASAQLTVAPASGVISSSSFTIVNAGNFRQPGPIPIYLKGATAGAVLCATPPQNVRGVLTYNSSTGLYNLTSVTVGTNGTGCNAATINAFAADQPPAQYGFEINTTDSTTYDVQNDSVGQSAGIIDRGSLTSAQYHSHVWDTNVGLSLWGNDYQDFPEIDSVYGIGIDFAYGTGSIISHPAFIYPASPTGTHAFDSVADYQVEAGATQMVITDSQCETINPNPGYVQLLDNTSGTPVAKDVGYGVKNASLSAAGIPSPMALPQGMVMRNAPPCSAAPTYQSGVFVDSVPDWSTKADRQLTFSAGNLSASTATPFLVAELYPYTNGKFNRSSLRITLTAGTSQGQLVNPFLDEITLGNTGSGLVYVHYPRGNSALNGSAYIQAYTQTNGAVNIYLVLATMGAGVVHIDQVSDPDTHLEVQPTQQAATGTLVFDSSAPSTYPAGAVTLASVTAGAVTASSVTSTSITSTTIASTNITSTTVASGSVTASGAVTAASLTAGSGGITTTGAVSTGSLTASNVTASGAVSAATLTAGAGGITTTGAVSTGSLTASSITASGAVSAASLAAGSGGITTTGAVSTGSLTASNVTATGAITAASLAAGSGGISATGAISTASSLAAASVAASGAITAASLTAGSGGITTTGAVSTGSLAASSVTATGAVAAASLAAGTGGISTTGTITTALVSKTVLGTDPNGKLIDNTALIGTGGKVWSATSAVASTSTGQVAAGMTQAGGITVTRLQVFAAVPPATCSTSYPVLAIYNATAATTVASVTMTSGTASYDSGVLSIAVPAGDKLVPEFTTAGAGCATAASGISFSLQYQ